ncbi:MAG: RHS repeat domain-containing protein, partial [Myxococcota bacterium]
ALTDENGNISWYAEYEPFGKVNIMIEKTTNNFRFPGQYYIQETGLYYNWNRWYNPDTGRHMQIDPYLDKTFYIYVSNNPMRLAWIYCKCYWYCKDCKLPIIWSGDKSSCEITYGILVNTGAGIKRGDNCACKKPGKERDCSKDCEKE